MRFMNDWEISDALLRYDSGATPNLLAGARIVARLRDWTNRNSDGWAYWPKPVRAAAKLMELLDLRPVYYDIDDITEADLRKAVSPIKAFLTREGVDRDTADRIINGPTALAQPTGGLR